MLNDLQEQVVDWGHKVGLLKKGTIEAQVGKLHEEVSELEEALDIYGMIPTENNPESLKHVMLEMGDVLVVLMLLAEMRGLCLETCLEKTLEKIKKRSGRMEGGCFVKK